MESTIEFAKVTSMVVLGGAAFLVTLLPVCINKKISSSSPHIHEYNGRSDFLLSLCLSFGGGVLLCTTFLHLLPEVSEGIEALTKEGAIPEDFPLPLPELIMCGGFFIMYVVEEIVHKYIHIRQMKKAKKGSDKQCSVSSVTLFDSDATLADDYKEHTNQDMYSVDFLPPSQKEDIKICASSTRNFGSSCTNSSGQEVNHQSNSLQHTHYDHDHEPHDVHGHTLVTSEQPSLRELLIVLALTIHEGFEGMAIGLERSVGAVWYLMTAVAVHKCVIAFCIGVELVSGHVSLPLSVFYAFIYSCASPFGIAIGFALTSTDDNPIKDLMSVVLQGLATGTLLYVVFFEILRRDTHGSGGMAEMIVVILGFVSMAAIMVFV